MHNRICLGFDYGTTKIGVAVGQTVTATATALAPIKWSFNLPNWLDIERLIALWQPTSLVIGLPLHMNGSENKMCKLVTHFAQTLKNKFELECYLVDERLTTASAKSMVSHNQGSTDSMAAAIIVTNWLTQPLFYPKV